MRSATTRRERTIGSSASAPAQRIAGHCVAVSSTNRGPSSKDGSTRCGTGSAIERVGHPSTETPARRKPVFQPAQILSAREGTRTVGKGDTRAVRQPHPELLGNGAIVWRTRQRSLLRFQTTAWTREGRLAQCRECIPRISVALPVERQRQRGGRPQDLHLSARPFLTNDSLVLQAPLHARSAQVTCERPENQSEGGEDPDCGRPPPIGLPAPLEMRRPGQERSQSPPLGALRVAASAGF